MKIYFNKINQTENIKNYTSCEMMYFTIIFVRNAYEHPNDANFAKI